MTGLPQAIGITIICLFFAIGIVSADTNGNNGSATSCENCSSLRPGDMTLLHMIQMSTGPVLSVPPDADNEGSWAFNFAGGSDDYDEGYTDDGYDPYDTGYDPFDTGYDPYDTGYDPYDTGYDPYDTGYDPFDTGYDPFDTGYDHYDPYNTGVIAGIPGSVISSGSLFPPGSQIVSPGGASQPASQVVSPGTSQGGYIDVIDAIGQVIQHNKATVKLPPKPKITTWPQPSGFKCILGICDCTGYQIYCQPSHKNDAAIQGEWKNRCCGDYSNPFNR